MTMSQATRHASTAGFFMSELNPSASVAGQMADGAPEYST
jgi:hypothetical protein